MTQTIYQVQGKEYATEPEAVAHLVSVLGVPVHDVDWLDVTTIQDGANGIRRYVSGVVNDEIEPDGDSDLEEWLRRTRQSPATHVSSQPAINTVQSDDCAEPDEA